MFGFQRGRKPFCAPRARRSLHGAQDGDPARPQTTPGLELLAGLGSEGPSLCLGKPPLFSQLWFPHVENGVTRATLPGSPGGLSGLAQTSFVPPCLAPGLSCPCFTPTSGWRCLTSSRVASRGRAEHAQASGLQQLPLQASLSPSRPVKLLDCLL